MSVGIVSPSQVNDRIYSPWQVAFASTYLPDREKDFVERDRKDDTGMISAKLSPIGQTALILGLHYQPHRISFDKFESPSWGRVIKTTAGWNSDAEGLERTLKGIRAPFLLSLRLLIALIVLPKNLLKLSEVSSLAAGLKLESIVSNPNRSRLATAPAFVGMAFAYVSWLSVFRPLLGPWNSIRAARNKMRPRMEWMPEVDENGLFAKNADGSLKFQSKPKVVPPRWNRRALAWGLIALSAVLSITAWSVALPFLVDYLLPQMSFKAAALTHGLTTQLSNIPKMGMLFNLYGDLATLIAVNAVGLVAAIFYASVEGYNQGERLIATPLPPGKHPRVLQSEAAARIAVQAAQVTAAVSPVSSTALVMAAPAPEMPVHRNEQPPSPTSSLGSTPQSGEVPIPSLKNASTLYGSPVNDASTTGANSEESKKSAVVPQRTPSPAH